MRPLFLMTLRQKVQKFRLRITNLKKKITEKFFWNAGSLHLKYSIKKLLINLICNCLGIQLHMSSMTLKSQRLHIST